MSSTALILRDWDAPYIHVLECDGPAINPVPNVHRYPGDFAIGHAMSFEEFTALPDHSKNPGPADWEMDHINARRIYRLVEHAAKNNGGWMSQRHLLEIRGRLKLLSPFCDEDI